MSYMDLDDAPPFSPGSCDGAERSSSPSLREDDGRACISRIIRTASSTISAFFVNLSEGRTFFSVRFSRSKPSSMRSREFRVCVLCLAFFSVSERWYIRFFVARRRALMALFDRGKDPAAPPA
jgi:hypothetical protein